MHLAGLWATREDLESDRVVHSTAIPLTLDESGELVRAFGVKPTVLIADGQGRTVHGIKSGEAQLSDELQALNGLQAPVLRRSRGP